MLFTLTSLFQRPEVPELAPAQSVPSEVMASLMSVLAPMGIIQTDLRGNCLFVNERWSQLTGMPPQRAVGQGWILAVYGDDRADFLSAWSKSTGSLCGFGLEHRLVGVNGDVVWVRSSVVPCHGADGAVTGFVATISEISERRRMEQALRDSESRLRVIFDTVVDGIITIDSKGQVRSYNPAASRIFGWTAEEIIGRPVTMLMPESERVTHETHVENIVGGAKSRVLGTGRELLGLHKSGSTFPLEIAISEFRTGAEVMFVGIVRDITGRKQVDRMKDEFISVVSHELRTPLTSVSGALSLIANGLAGELPKKGQQLVEIAHNNCSRLVSQLNDILDIECLSANRMVFRDAPADLVELVDRAVDMCKFNGTDTRFEISKAQGFDEAMVKGDAGRIVQVIGNLLSNAIKHSPVEEVVEIAITRRGGWWRVAVTDHGRGVPKDFRPRVFQRFAHADGLTQRAKSGIGLGLAISQEIVRKQGGHIGFDSGEKKGATFWFELPVLCDQVIPAEPKDADARNCTHTQI